MEQKAKPKLIVAGGGTGGHVLAGIAIADTWKAKTGGGSNVLFVGAYGGLEEKLVPRAGYKLKLLKLGSLNRVSWGRKLKTLFQLPLSFLRSVIIVIRYRPNAVVGVGGYASGPLVLIARAFKFLGVHTAILEQNVVPGMTNRILGRVVDWFFCAFPRTETFLPKNRVIVTGNPVRSTMQKLPPSNKNPFTVFIFGGSQGAIGINTLVIDALPELKDPRANVRFIHQTGEKDYHRVLDAYKRNGINARVEKFIYDMAGAYAESSLLICRAGSSTLAEIAAVGRAAILIPFPQASDNHQERNARVFEKAGAAKVVLQEEAKGFDLAKLIFRLYDSKDEIKDMETKVLKFHRPYAAEDIVRILLGNQKTLAQMSEEWSNS